MFGIGGTEFIVLVIILAVLIGPEQIPSIVRHVQKFIKEITKARSDFQQSVRQDETLRSLKDTVDEVKRGVRQQVDDVTAGVRADLKKLEEVIAEHEEKEEKNDDSSK